MWKGLRMTHKIRYSEAEDEPRSPLVKVLRLLILAGVWTLVALAGVVVWARLSA